MITWLIDFRISQRFFQHHKQHLRLWKLSAVVYYKRLSSQKFMWPELDFDFYIFVIIFRGESKFYKDEFVSYLITLFFNEGVGLGNLDH